MVLAPMVDQSEFVGKSLAYLIELATNDCQGMEGTYTFLYELRKTKRPTSIQPYAACASVQ